MQIVRHRNLDAKVFGPMREEHTRGVFNEDGQFDAANQTLVRRIGSFLTKKYPGHPWAVSSEIEHGHVKIAIQGFQQWPYVIRLTDLSADPRMDCVMRGAGELLERLKMPRSTFNLADWKSATTRMPLHFMRNRNDPRRSTVVPVHAGKDIKRGLLHKIIGDAGLTVDEFKALL